MRARMATSDAGTSTLARMCARGSLLAEIETPELDQQLQQAEADLKSAEANMQLAQTTSVRWQSLLQKHAVSKQETDQMVSDYAARAGQLCCKSSQRSSPQGAAGL